MIVETIDAVAELINGGQGLAPEIDEGPVERRAAAAAGVGAQHATRRP